MKYQILFILGFLITSIANGQNEKSKNYYSKGYEAIDKQAYSKAIKFLIKAIEEDTTGDCGTGVKGKAQGELGYAYLRSGDQLNAELFFNKSKTLDPTNPFPRQNLAALYAIQNKNTEAIQELNELIQIKSDFIEAYIQRGFIYNANNQKEQAQKDFETALELNSKAKVLPAQLIQDLKEKIKEIKNGK